MRCSVIIPFFQNLVHLETAVHHAERALANIVSEIIVVNDNPSIELPMAIAKKVKTIKLDENKGYSNACNEGANQATGEYLFFQDSDVFVEERCIISLIECATHVNNVAVSACVLRSNDWKIHHFGIGFFKTDVIKPFRGASYRKNLPEMLKFQALTSDSMLIKRKLFLKCGGLDSKLRNSYSDLDFGFKLNEIGGSNIVYPAAISFHRSRSAGPIRTHSSEDNKCAFLMKWGSKMKDDYSRLFSLYPYKKLLRGIACNDCLCFSFLSSPYAESYQNTLNDIISHDLKWINLFEPLQSGAIRLEDHIPWSLISSSKRIIFFVDSIDQLAKNEFFIRNRISKRDVCIDTNANVVSMHQLSDHDKYAIT